MRNGKIRVINYLYSFFIPSRGVIIPVEKWPFNHGQEKLQKKKKKKKKKYKMLIRLRSIFQMNNTFRSRENKSF
jgi:hypothetical protein